MALIMPRVSRLTATLIGDFLEKGKFIAKGSWLLADY
jgi:hypothetical protein